MAKSVASVVTNSPIINRAAGISDSPDTRHVGGVYNWKSMEAAKLGHGPEFQKRIQVTFGSQPAFQYFTTPIVIDNTTNQVIDEAA